MGTPENDSDEKIIASLKREPAEELRRLQRKPYEWKVKHALDVIREFVQHEGENGVYVSFSGGKDSLVLLHLVHSIYPDTPAIFANTGIEFPEQVKFVRTFPNVIEVHPVKHFPKIRTHTRSRASIFAHWASSARKSSTRRRRSRISASIPPRKAGPTQNSTLTTSASSSSNTTRRGRR